MSRRASGRPLVLLGINLVFGGLPSPVDAQASGGAGGPTGEAAPVLDLYVPALDGVAVTDEIVALGRSLFMDPVLSRDGTLSCAGCHQPQHAFSGTTEVAVGVDGRTGPRNVPALINRGYGRSFSWDGRATTLLEQVLLPIENPLELDVSVETVVTRLRRDPAARDAFRGAFGEEPTRARLAQALAAYVASIRSQDAPFDLHFLGDTLALTQEERDGRLLFLGKARCAQCHLGPNLTDEAFHVTGVAWRSGWPDDPGRFAITGDSTHLGAFKTPTLREVARTAPYMHDGSIATLEEVIDFYDQGGVANPRLDTRIAPRHLTAREKRALVAFLGSLNGTVQEPCPTSAFGPKGHLDSLSLKRFGTVCIAPAHGGATRDSAPRSGEVSDHHTHPRG